MIRHGCQNRYPKEWLDGGTDGERRTKRLEVQFNPVFFALKTKSILVAEGIQIMYDTRLCEVLSEEIHPYAAAVENESGRGTIRFGATVDATGSCRLMQLAAEKTRKHEKTLARLVKAE